METLTNNNVSKIKNFNSNHENIKQLLKSFWSETSTMAIKQNQSSHENAKDAYEFVYSDLNKLPSQSNHRMSMTEAKRAFLNSTVNNTSSLKSNKPTEYPVLHYAQLAMVRDNEDSRSTGGGKDSSLNYDQKNEIQNITSVKSIEQKRVSFKVRPASTLYRKPPISTKTVTITNTKVSELTKKFNNLIEESAATGAKTKTMITPSNVSSPSSTLSSSPNIKIVLRQKRGNRKRNKKKRCSSMVDMEDSSTSSKTNVSRSKSDGVKFRKSKKILRYESSEPNSGTDSNDSNNSKSKTPNKRVESKIKNVITKFEFEIIAQKNQNFNLIKSLPSNKTMAVTQIKEKPKVPEKKSTLTLTKNLVVKDGVPKIMLLKPISPAKPAPENNKKIGDVSPKKKDQVYDKLKFRTNYIHSDKLPLKVVEIIPEDINEVSMDGALDSKSATEDVNNYETYDIIPNLPVTNTDSKYTDTNLIKNNWNNQEIQGKTNIVISPNNSFLWRRSDSLCEKQNVYDYNQSMKTMGSPIYERIHSIEKSHHRDSDSLYQFNKTVINIDNADFESDLVEAVNPVLVDNDGDYDDYEPLAPREINNVVVIPVRTVDRKSKINCPLPEIPTQDKPLTDQTKNKNDYQCLLEMRSHPEGDDSSVHNYEECENRYEERTRGDGDSDDGYEYCTTQVKPYCLMSSSGLQIAESFNPVMKNSARPKVTKSPSNASSVSYEQIGSAREHYDCIQVTQRHEPTSSGIQNWPSHSSSESNITMYNDNENIYDIVKLSDSTSNCYESVPSSPSVAKMRPNLRKQLASAVRKRLSLDSQSTVTSDQKTNSIYEKRSMRNYSGQNVDFQVPSSESGSDRSDDWVDLSDDEKNASYGEQKIIIVQERGRGKNPLSWSQKVRHQWQNHSIDVNDDKEVFVTSPTKVHILTCEKSTFFSRNDELVRRIRSLCSDESEKVVVTVIDVEEQESWIKVVTSFLDGENEIQENVAFIESDASDFGHVYESLGPPAQGPPVPPAPFDEDFDSFDSDSDFDNDSSQQKSVSDYKSPSLSNQPSDRLPSPPTSGQYTLIKIANAAQKKMKQLKRNLTKKYTNGVDQPKLPSAPSAGIYDSFKNLYKSTYKTPSPSTVSNKQEETEHIYSNLEIPTKDRVELKKTDSPPKLNGFKEELMTVLGEKRPSNGDTSTPPPRPSLPSPALIERVTSDNPESPSNPSRKDPGTLRKIKSRFRRAASMATDMDADIPSVLKITNSTFYLTDSMDSGFSNCSDSGAGEPREAPPPAAPPRHGKLRHAWSESSPCLALPRPAVPPPPPPNLPPANVSLTPVTPPPSSPDQISAVNEELKRLLPTLRKDKDRRSRTSWYADAGELQIGNSSWYSEIGLLPVGNISSSSGASSGSHPASPLPRTLFPHEPLYQFYNAAKVESQCREGDSDSEAYEGVAPAAARSSAMALVAPRGPARTLWCEVPEVRASTVLSSLAPTQKRLQEAKFELLTSEASYLNSLNVLESHFIAHPAFRESSILTREDREILFGTILPVKKCSQMLMNELEKCWQENILLTGICDIVRKHAEQQFGVYVKYCENQSLMVRALQRLREKPSFANTLRRLESHPACQSLSLHSFLMLPMQRITRLPLLLDAVLRTLAPPDDEYDSCMHALAVLNHYVSACNEGARNTERVEEMFRLSRQIEFPPALHDAPVIGPALSRRDRKPVRWLVRSGEMTQLVWKTDEIKLTFGKRFNKIPLHLFLFNDVLVITKKKGEDSYIAKEWCPRALLAVSSNDVTANAKHALLLTLLEDSKGRTQEMLMSCESETCVSRWMEVLTPPSAERLGIAGVAGDAGDAGDAVYAGWDCPQVNALYSYAAAQPDELSLEQGDIVNVTRKTSEGWYYGERTRDGAAGWFPGAYCAEIMSPHVRARNLRQRYRLLALSSSYRGHRRKP